MARRGDWIEGGRVPLVGPSVFAFVSLIRATPEMEKHRAGARTRLYPVTENPGTHPVPPPDVLDPGSLPVPLEERSVARPKATF